MNTKIHTVIIFVLFVSILTRQAQAQDPEKKWTKTCDAIKHTMESLCKIKVKAWDVDIPDRVKPLFTELKHELVDLISQTMNDDTLHWKSSADLRTEVISRLRRAGIDLPKENGDKDREDDRNREYAYDQIYGIIIDSPLNHKNLLVVTTTLWVMCGEDTSFYIFKKNEKGWGLLIAQEARDYKDIKGAHAWFGYSISPADNKGLFFVVTANVNPWCTSNWQGLRYSVLRAGENPYKPKVLLEKSDTIYLGIDPPVYKITTQIDKFELQFYGDWYLTPDTGASPQYVVYSVTGDNIKLVKKGRLNK